MSVKTIMDTWTLQAGFPVVSVKRNYGNNTATIIQNRFLIAGVEDDYDEYRWWIPLSFSQPGGSLEDRDRVVWMRDDEKEKEVTRMPEEGTAVIFNIQQTGYYR